MSKNWNLKYFEKNKTESHLNIFKSLEIEHYLEQLLKEKFNVFNIRLNFSSTTLTVFLFVYEMTKKQENNKIMKISSKTIEKRKKRLSRKQISKNLKKFTNNKFHINLKIRKLEKFNKLPPLATNFNRLFQLSDLEKLFDAFATKTNSVKLLGELIAKQLAVTKRHNFFLNELKRNLKLLLIKQGYSRVNGLKILIKGRLNNAPRSQTKIIKLGKIPITTQATQIEYFKSTAFTANGTIGVQIWVNLKEQAKCFYNQKNTNTKKRKKENYKN